MTYHIAHLADLHVGFRQFNKTTPGGINQREADVTEALRRVVSAVIDAAPDLIVIAGDVFHHVRPPNAAILALFAQLQRLRVGLPTTPIVVIAGNHDTPRTLETASVLPLYRALDVKLAIGTRPETFCVDEKQRLVYVTAVPSAAERAFQAAPYPPTTGASHSILLMHAAWPIAPAVLEGGWSYIALGDYHVHHRVSPSAWYPGSIDYTSSNPWGELEEQRRWGVEGKGWILATLEPGQPPHVGFRSIVPPRDFLDLEPIEAEGMAAAELDAAIAARCTAARIDGAAVRLVVHGVSRELGAALDWPAIRAQKARALDLQLKLERPESRWSTPERRQASRRSILQAFDDFLVARELAPDIDRDELRKLGQHFLEQAQREGDKE